MKILDSKVREVKRSLFGGIRIRYRKVNANAYCNICPQCGNHKEFDRYSSKASKRNGVEYQGRYVTDILLFFERHYNVYECHKCGCRWRSKYYKM